MDPPNELITEKLWFHGTTCFFKRWKNPPVAPLSNGLTHHSFISLSLDIKYARVHQGLYGGICAAKLAPPARVLDLRIKTSDSLLLWKKTRSTSLGSKYYGLNSASEWYAACQTGSVLRFVFESIKDAPKLFEQQEMARTSIDNCLRLDAAIYVQNFTREWIEAVISPAKDMGYDAVICNELDHALSSTASTQLFVFNVKHLSQPDWITLPSLKPSY